MDAHTRVHLRVMFGHEPQVPGTWVGPLVTPSTRSPEGMAHSATALLGLRCCAGSPCCFLPPRPRPHFPSPSSLCSLASASASPVQPTRSYRLSPASSVPEGSLLSPLASAFSLPPSLCNVAATSCRWPFTALELWLVQMSNGICIFYILIIN